MGTEWDSHGWRSLSALGVAQLELLICTVLCILGVMRTLPGLTRGANHAQAAYLSLTGTSGPGQLRCLSFWDCKPPSKSPSPVFHHLIAGV